MNKNLNENYNRAYKNNYANILENNKNLIILMKRSV